MQTMAFVDACARVWCACRKIDPSKAAWRHVLRRLREEHMYLSTPNVVATMRILAQWRTHGCCSTCHDQKPRA